MAQPFELLCLQFALYASYQNPEIQANFAKVEQRGILRALASSDLLAVIEAGTRRGTAWYCTPATCTRLVARFPPPDWKLQLPYNSGLCWFEQPLVLPSSKEVRGNKLQALVWSLEGERVIFLPLHPPPASIPLLVYPLPIFALEWPLGNSIDTAHNLLASNTDVQIDVLVPLWSELILRIIGNLFAGLEQETLVFENVTPTWKELERCMPIPPGHKNPRSIAIITPATL